MSRVVLTTLAAFQAAILGGAEEPTEVVLKGQSGRVNSVALSRDGTILAAGSGAYIGLLQHPRPGELIIWDVARGTPLQRLTGHKDGVSCVSFSPDGKRLFSVDFAGLAAFWDSATWKPLQWKQFDAALLSCSFSKTGERLALGSWGGAKGGVRNAVYLLDGRTAEVNAVLAGHEEGVPAVAFAPDGQTIASGGMDSMLILWDLKQKAPSRRLEQSTWIYGLDLSPDGKHLAVVGGDAAGKIGDVTVYDDKFNHRTEFVPAHRDVVRAVRFSPDGGKLATGDFSGNLRIWDVRGPKPSLVLDKQTSGLVRVLQISETWEGRARGSSDEGCQVG